MMTRIKKLLFVLLLSAGLTAPAFGQSFSARVNRSTVPEGETFLLTLELEGAGSQNTPDLAVLNQDFTIYSVSNAYRTKMINNQVEQTRQWNLVMMPKRTGQLVIPAITLDQYRSQPVTILVPAAGESVSAAAAGATDANLSRFRMEGSVNNLTPYVQQQIVYTLKLYDSGGLQGEEPMFMTTGDDWIIRSLGSPQINSKTVNGRHLREITFKYALFPQRSGELTVPEVKFNGFYLTKDTRRDPFADIFGDDLFIAGFGMADVFATRNPVVLTAKPIKVNVRPAAETGDWWLPASEVELYAAFEPSPPVFKVGEAVNRTIYLKAAGVVDSQLPDIRFNEAAGVRQYPEKPEVEMKVENDQVISLEKITNIYIPEQSGQITLPEVAVNWFDVKNGRAEKAVLPPMTVTVRPAAGQAAQPAPAPKQPETKPENTGAPDLSAASVSAAPVETIDRIKPAVVYLLLAIAFAAGILVSWLIMRSLGGKAKQPSGTDLKKAVRQNTQAGDWRGLRDALLLWAKEFYARPDLTSLQQVGALSGDPDFISRLEQLNALLYGEQSPKWDAKKFLQIFEKINRQSKRNNQSDEPLPKLYKN